MTDESLPIAPPRPVPPRAVGYAAALALTGLATLAAVAVDRWAAIPNLSLVFVLPVVIAAASFGWGPALMAAVAGTTAFNFFLIAPRYTFHVADPANVWALGLLLVVAAIVCAVAAEARRRAVEARRHADQTEALQALAKALMAAGGRTDIAEAAAGSLARLFASPATVLLMEGDALQVAAAAGGAPSPADLDAARWSLAARLPSRGRSYPIEEATYDFWPVVTRSRRQAVVGVQISGGDPGRPLAPERLVDMVCGYLAAALERDHFAGQAMQAKLETESQKLKADLLAAVSHDLRTPLATILFTLQSLQRFDAAHPPETRAELLALAEAETARLSGLVANLLDMSRIDADAVTVRTAPACLADLAASAVARAGLEGRASVEGDGGAAEVEVDYALAETALANVLENAGKYSPPGSPITVRTAVEDGAAVIEVVDQGTGFPEAIEPLFEKFARGVEGDGRPPGTGLGLAIARGFLAAMGGGIEAANRADAPGATVRIRLPLAGAAA